MQLLQLSKDQSFILFFLIQSNFAKVIPYLGLALSQPLRRFLQVIHPERVQGVPD
jgi:hypothetical protein